MTTIKSVWGLPKDHPDYFKLVLRNGTISEDFSSYNNRVSTDFLENRPSYARYMSQHKFNTQRPLKFLDKRGLLEMEVKTRNDIAELRGGIDENDFKYYELIKNNPTYSNQSDIYERISLLEREIPEGTPFRRDIIDELTRDYILTKFKVSGLKTQSSLPFRETRETPQQRINRINSMRLQQEQEAQRIREEQLLAEQQAVQQREMERREMERRAVEDTQRLIDEARRRREEFRSEAGAGAGSGFRPLEPEIIRTKSGTAIDVVRSDDPSDTTRYVYTNRGLMSVDEFKKLTAKNQKKVLKDTRPRGRRPRR